METDKKKLRAQFLKIRNALSEKSRTSSGEIIFERIVDQPAWNNARVILMYVSTSSEVETRPLMEEAWRQGKHVVVPLIHPDRNMTQLSELKRLGDLRPSLLPGVLEPAIVAQNLIDPGDVDLALLPGVAFDRFGGRLGQGGGYFDRLLPHLTKAVLWGLAFAEQISENALPMQAHDHPMHAIVTEDEMIYPEEVG